MKNYKNYHTKANDKILHDAKVVSRATFSSIETETVLINNSVETNLFFYDKFSSIMSLKYAIDENELLTYGDVVHLKNGQKWIVISYENDNPLYKKWVLRLCQLSIKWIDENAMVHEYPCVLDYNTKSNFGERDDRVMTLPDGRRQIILRKDQHSVKLNRTRRFIIGDEAFEVVDYDYISDLGLVNLSLKTTQISPVRDNMELGIADYYNRQNTYSLEIKNSDNLSINANQALQLDIIATKNGVQVDVNEISLSSSNEHVGIIDRQGLFTPTGIGQVTISAEYMEQVVTVNILVRDIQVYNYSVDIVGSDYIEVGQLETYKAVFKNNGEVINEAASFNLFSDDGVSTTKLAKISNVLANEIKILAGDKLGYIQLHVVSDNKLISGIKTIRVKGFF